MTQRAVLHDDGRWRLVLEFGPGRVFLHLRVARWNVSVLRLMRARWPAIRELLLRDMGYPAVHAFYRESNALMSKFAARFGFREVRRYGGFVLLETDHA